MTATPESFTRQQRLWIVSPVAGKHANGHLCPVVFAGLPGWFPSPPDPQCAVILHGGMEKPAAQLIRKAALFVRSNSPNAFNASTV